MSGRRVDGARGQGIMPLVWLLILYAGFVYLAVGTISVSQINSKFGDHAGSIFHLADLVDRLRDGKLHQLQRAEQSLETARQMRDSYLLGLVSVAQQVGLSREAVKAALSDQANPARLDDLGIHADPAIAREWDGGVAAYIRENLTMELAQEQRVRVLAQIRGGLESILGDDSLDGKVLGHDAAEVETAAAVVTGLRGFGFSWLFTVPQEVLTLILALALGALGATLHMTKTTLDGGPDQSPVWYLFRPCQGVLMALVVFILLKAGQLTIGVGNNDALNPFFVAFVGIISGLLAQDAYRMVIQAGSKLIPTEQAEVSRWAFGLAEKMAAAGIDAATLASCLGMPEDALRSWMDEGQAVPAREQGLIAAWLRTDPRLLFTADPPSFPDRSAGMSSSAPSPTAAPA